MTTQNSPAVTLLGFEPALSAVQTELEKALLKVPPAFQAVTGHLTRSKGKNIRAFSLLSCAIDKDGTVHPDAVSMAVGVELLHLATLVHDDIIDDSPVRRGEETLQKKFGKRPAVICGDYLFCLALQTAAKVQKRDIEVPDPLPTYMTRICLGEMRQNMNNRNFDLSQFDYLKIIAGKTAALFEACFHSGFLLSGEDKSEKGKYTRLGRYIGMIFQLADDYMDYVSSEEKSKKPVKSDFEQGVITLPLIYSMNASQLFRTNIKSNKLSTEEVSSAVTQNGGLDYVQKVIKKYYDKAMKLIHSIGAIEEKKEHLKLILDKATNGILS